MMSDRSSDTGFCPEIQLIIALNRSLIATEREVAEFVKKVKRDKAWMTDFNVERNYSSPFRVEELMEDWALTHSAVVQVFSSIRSLKRKVR